MEINRLRNGSLFIKGEEANGFLLLEKLGFELIDLGDGRFIYGFEKKLYECEVVDFLNQHELKGMLLIKL